MHESEKCKWIRSVVSDSLRPHRLQPTRLLRPWDFPGKSTGVGCHCLLRFWSWLVLKHSGTFLEGADQNLPITEHFPDPCQPPISLSLSFFTTLKSLDFPQLCCVFPSFPVCILFYYILFRAVSLLKKKYAFRIRKIYLNKYLSSKWLSYFILMPSKPSLKRVDRVKFLLVAMMVRPVYIITNITVIYIIIGN